MKTLLKKIGILIIMMVALCGAANAQNVYYYCGEKWMNGYTDTISSHWVTNYYQATSISGIAGDTILMGYKNSSGTFLKVIWVESNPYTFVETNIDTSKFLSVMIYSDTQNPWTYYAKDTMSGSNLVGGSGGTAPKFVPSDVVLSDSTSNKSTSILLKLSDFNITVSSPNGGFKAYCDSVYWYLDGSLIYGGMDTTYLATASGEYNVKVKLVYVTKYLVDTSRFERFQLSNTLTVTVDVIISVKETESETIFKVYPNPTSDYLYISDEVEYTIYSITGKEVLKGKNDKVDVSNLEPGVYLLRTVENKTTKFVVK